jgi:ABC-2 type transport system permease protein
MARPELFSASLIPFWVMFRKDLRIAYRSPVAFGLLIAMPFLLIAVLSEAFSPLYEGRNVFDLPVIDLASTPGAASLVSALDEQDSLNLKPIDWEGGSFTSEDASDLMNDNRRYVAVLVIAPSPVGSERPAVTLYTDPSQPGFTRVIRDAVAGQLESEALLDRLSVDVAEASGVTPEEARAGIDAAARAAADSVAISVETLSESGDRIVPSRFEQTVPGFSVMFTFWLAMLVAVSIYTEKKEYRTWRRTLVSPAPAWTIVSARVLAYVCLGLAQMTVMFALGAIFFGIDIGWNFPALIVIFTALALVTTGFGFLMSSLIKDMAMLSMAMNLMIIVMAGLGGALIPAAFLPSWAEPFSVVTPHYWAMNGIQEVIVLGHGMAGVYPQVLALLAFAAVFFALGSLRFRVAE